MQRGPWQQLFFFPLFFSFLQAVSGRVLRDMYKRCATNARPWRNFVQSVIIEASSRDNSIKLAAPFHKPAQIYLVLLHDTSGLGNGLIRITNIGMGSKTIMIPCNSHTRQPPTPIRAIQPFKIDAQAIGFDRCFTRDSGVRHIGRFHFDCESISVWSIFHLVNCSTNKVLGDELSCSAQAFNGRDTIQSCL